MDTPMAWYIKLQINFLIFFLEKDINAITEIKVNPVKKVKKTKKLKFEKKNK